MFICLCRVVLFCWSICGRGGSFVGGGGGSGGSSSRMLGFVFVVFLFSLLGFVGRGCCGGCCVFVGERGGLELGRGW